MPMAVEGRPEAGLVALAPEQHQRPVYRFGSIELRGTRPTGFCTNRCRTSKGPVAVAAGPRDNNTFARRRGWGCRRGGSGEFGSQGFGVQPLMTQHPETPVAARAMAVAAGSDSGGRRGGAPGGSSGAGLGTDAPVGNLGTVRVAHPPGGVPTVGSTPNIPYQGWHVLVSSA